MRVWHEADLVVKEAESEPERLRLGREAEVLRAMAHPGVVRVARVEGADEPDRPERLCLHRVAGTSLADLEPQPVAAVAGWGAAVATVLADLHDLGYVHGDIRAEHILIDEHGRPVLCGFASARRVPPGEAAPFHADVAALAELVAARLAPGELALHRVLSRFQRSRPGHRPDARALAAALVRQVPDARVGASDTSSGPAVCSRPRAHAPVRRRLAVVGAAGLSLAVAATAVALVVPALHPSRAPGPRSNVAYRSPVPAYVVESAPGEHPVTVLGRWGCGPATPAVLDTGSGAVWLFSGWPAAGATATGRLVQRVPAADGLAVLTGPAGCDRLVVLREGAPDLTLAIGAGR